MTRPFFDGYGMVSGEHQNEPAPRRRRQDKVRLEHETYSVTEQRFVPCETFYDPDDVTVIRDGKQVRREVYCSRCREPIDLSTRRSR